MATDATLHALGIEITTTPTKTHPDGVHTLIGGETETLGVGTATDLADNRTGSAELIASSAVGDKTTPRPPGAGDGWPGLDYAVLEVWLETSEDNGAAGGAGWRECARFARVQSDFARERVSFVADRYLRAAWRVAPRNNQRAGIKFSVTARCVGSAT
jgi:hypothetical protein